MASCPVVGMVSYGWSNYFEKIGMLGVSARDHVSHRQQVLSTLRLRCCTMALDSSAVFKARLLKLGLA
eukprot:1793945-Karenia_brevis.AAC.1